MKRYLCERCGGTGQQSAGQYSVVTGKYDSLAGQCDDCYGKGYLGIGPEPVWPHGPLSLEGVETVLGIDPKYWDRMERGAVIQSKGLDNYLRLWAAFGSEIKVNKLLKCVKSTNMDLQVGKTYERIPDSESERHGFYRVNDDSEEDYLYPQNWFVPHEDPEPKNEPGVRA